MLSEDLYKTVEKIDSVIMANNEPSQSEESRAFGRLTKLTEEVGELAAAVLAKYGYQRDSKLKDFNDEKLSHEVADVILTTLLLAKTLGVDVETGLKSKIDKIEQRFEEGIR